MVDIASMILNMKMREIECDVGEFLGQGFEEDEQHIRYQPLPYVPGNTGDPLWKTRCSLTKNWHIR